MNATILDPVIYERAKKKVYAQYSKPSAFRSGALVKMYKEMGGRYGDVPKKDTALKRWFKEEWRDVGGRSYPVFRPTKRVSKDTPLTVNEIDPSNLKKQIQRKQRIKGSKNLSPFRKK